MKTPNIETRHIVQLIPAPGWEAVFAQANGDDKAIPYTKPLACFALVDRNSSHPDASRRTVEGLASDPEMGLVFCQDNIRWAGYKAPGQPLSAFQSACDEAVLDDMLKMVDEWEQEWQAAARARNRAATQSAQPNATQTARSASAKLSKEA